MTPNGNIQSAKADKRSMLHKHKKTTVEII